MENNTSTNMRQIRSENLIAHFTNGYADNWFMAVGEQFKNELDIKKTNRKKNGKNIGVWTQGVSYNFKEGQVFYDTPDGYSTWSKALGKITYTCQILKAGAKTIATKYRDANEGFVEFAIYKTNTEKTNIIELDRQKLTQSDFVVFLNTGMIGDRKINLIYG